MEAPCCSTSSPGSTQHLASSPRLLRRPAPQTAYKTAAKARRQSTVRCAAQPRQFNSKSRGKALLQGTLRPAEDDPELHETIRQVSEPIEAVAQVQWYPGHIAKAERSLREQLSAVDIVVEVRDGRIPMSTRHPKIPEWVGSKPRLMVLNRRDMVPDDQAAKWTAFFRSRGHPVVWTNAHQGEGVPRVSAAALAASTGMNEKRLKRGLRPRPVRAVVVGFPNVGKSALINRLLGRRMADSAPRPGVTRVLQWMRIGGDLDLLDAPGIIPMSFRDQVAAQRLAICNDIGEASYVASLVAAGMLRTLRALPDGGRVLRQAEARYGVRLAGRTEEDFVHALAERSFNDEPERAGQRLLRDFRQLALGRTCLELPDQYEHYKEV